MSIYLGVGLALCSCTCSAVGYVLQKRAHLRYDAAVAAAASISAASSPSGTSAGSQPCSQDVITAPIDIITTQNNSIAAELPLDCVAVEERLPLPVNQTSPTVLPLTKADLDDTTPLPASPIINTHAPPKSYMTYWQFPAGLALLIAGTLCAAFVLGLAPQSTLAPLGSVTMILNTIFAWKFLGEAFTRIDLAAVLLMAAGTTLAVSFGKGVEPKLT